MQEMEEGTRPSQKALLRRRKSKVYACLTIERLDSIKVLCDYWTDEPAVPIDGRGNTLLHLLVIRGNDEGLKHLMEVVKSYENLKKKNIRGDTALHEAARCGNAKAAVLLLEKEKKLISMLSCPVSMCNCKNCTMASLAKKDSLVSIPNEMGETALFLAAAFGQMVLFQTILRYNDNDCTTTRNDGCTVLHAAITGEYYRTATKLLRKQPELAQKRNKKGETALNLLAASPSSFRSNSVYVYSNMGKTSFVPLQVLRVLFYKCLPSKYSIKTIGNDDVDPDNIHPEKKFNTHVEDKKRLPVIDHLLGLPWIQPIDDANQKNKLAVALAKQLLECETDWSGYTYLKPKYGEESPSLEKNNGVKLNPLIQAIEMGIPELVEEILRYFPDAANSFDKDGKNVFHIAAEHRSGDIYEKLKESAINKDRMLLDVDNQGNTILHHATKTKIVTKFSLGVANLMAWDVFWFQRIRHDCSPHLLHMQNNEGNTAEQLLLKDYKSKREAAESAVKEMNQGLMVVAALVATVSFAAVFTIPGGFDQTKGNPLFYNDESDHKNDLNLFLGYVGLTFFASLLALATLLSIQLSRFNMDDLYFSLPLKYSIAISFLFLSSCSTITTFLQALILEDYLPPYYLTCLIIGGVVMGLVYVDSIYDVLSYLVEVLRYSRTYRTQERDGGSSN